MTTRDRTIPAPALGAALDACPFCWHRQWDTTIILWTGRKSTACEACAEVLSGKGLAAYPIDPVQVV